MSVLADGCFEICITLVIVSLGTEEDIEDYLPSASRLESFQQLSMQLARPGSRGVEQE